MSSAPVELVLSRWPTAKASNGGWLGRCPAHKDGSPSLKLDQGTDGRALLRCYANCRVEDIVAKMGLRMADLMPETDLATFGAGYVPPKASHLRVEGAASPALAAPAAAPKPTPRAEADEKPTTDPKTWPVVATYAYERADGVPVYYVDRKKEPEGRRKTFLQRQPNGVYSLKDVDRVLYRLPAVQRAIATGDVVLLVEGEEDVHAAERLGWTATTNCGGSGGWRPEYAQQLRHADVVLLPDNDTPGREWAAKAAADLTATARRVRIVALPRVPEKGDLRQWVDEYEGTGVALVRLILAAKVWQIGDPIPEPVPASKFRLYRADELAALPPPRWLVQGLLPADSLAAFVGESGKGKTFVTIGLGCALAAAKPWLGVSVGTEPQTVLYIAAEGTSGLRQRVAAWTSAHGVTQSMPLYFICETVNLLEPGDVEHVVRAIAALPNPPVLIVVDTLHRAMPGGDENSSKDMGLVVTNAARIKHASGATVMLVHHTRKGDDVERGSGSLRAAVDTLWLLKDDDTTLELVCEKQKDAGKFDAMRLALVPMGESLIAGRAPRSSDDEDFPAADPDLLKPNELTALRALARASGTGGLTSTEWKETTRLPGSSFYRAKGSLETGGLVQEGQGGRGSRHTLTTLGRTALTVARRDAQRASETTARQGETAPGAAMIGTGSVTQVTPKLTPNLLPNHSQVAPNAAVSAGLARAEFGTTTALTALQQPEGAADKAVLHRNLAPSVSAVLGASRERDKSLPTSAGSKLGVSGSDVAVSGSDTVRRGAGRSGSRRAPAPDQPPAWVLEQRPISEDEAP